MKQTVLLFFRFFLKKKGIILKHLAKNFSKKTNQTIQQQSSIARGEINNAVVNILT